MKRHYLAFDLGAESGRAMLGQKSNGQIELTEVHRFSNNPVNLPTGRYWDTFRLFGEMCEGLRLAGRSADRIDSIAVDTWGVDFGLLGADGALIDNPRHYRDERTRGAIEEVSRKVSKEDIFRQTGIQFMEINSLYQLASIQRDRPELLQMASKLLFMPDLFNYFLTGVYSSERTITSTSQFYNPVKKGFATDMLRKLGISGAFFADLIDPGHPLGPVLPIIADHAMLDYVPTVCTTGGHDTASAIAAVPVRDASDWCYISSGTWSLIGVELDKPLINDAAREANFTNEVGVADTIRFLKNVAGLWILQECRRDWARQGHDHSYAELLERAAAAKPLDTVIDPDEFVKPGRHVERIREYCRKTGQEIPQDVGSTVRVVLHSLAVRYKSVIEKIEELTGKKIKFIHIVGGGSRNYLLNQLTANVTGRTVIAGPVEATAAGNVLIQALGAGDVSDLSDLRSVVARSFETEKFTPY